jgi:transposase, IS30 family
MARFVNAQVPEVVQPFWAALQRGAFIADAAVAVGTYRKQGTRWVAVCGGVRPRRGRNLKGRCLSFAEREEIALARARGETIRAIARRLGRSPSTISRELRRNADRRDGGYRATTAHALAYERAGRPKPAKLATNLALREIVQDDLTRRFSPRADRRAPAPPFPDQPEMWVSAETIYQSLYVQSRGALRRELTRYLRTGRALRKPGRQPGQRKNRIPDMVHISERPPEADERRVPGHWEGDLLIGKRNQTAIGTLVERSSGFAMRVPLPDGYKPEHVAPALARKVQTLPEALRRSLTWDQGPEMRDWTCTSTPASTCSSASRTPRGSAAPTRTPTGCSGGTSPKGFDFATVTETELDAVADQLNDRPRKRFDFATPTEQLAELLLQ